MFSHVNSARALTLFTEVRAFRIGKTVVTVMFLFGSPTTCRRPNSRFSRPFRHIMLPLMDFDPQETHISVFYSLVQFHFLSKYFLGRHLSNVFFLTLAPFSLALQLIQLCFLKTLSLVRSIFLNYFCSSY